jgi:hypothetical protein
MRRERGSVIAVLPASSCEVKPKARGEGAVRIVGLDIHRVFAEAVMLDDGRAVRLGRIGMTREHLEAFARKLRRDDDVVVEATGNATAVAEVIAHMSAGSRSPIRARCG